MNCMFCGKPLKNGAKFCSYCGAGVQQAPPHQNADYRQSASAGAAHGGGYGPPPGYGYSAHAAAGMARGAARGGARAARSVAQLKILCVIAAALLAIMSILYVTLLKPGKPEDTVAKLEEAMNELDQTKMLECFDSQAQDLYNGALGVGGSLLGADLSSLSQFANGLGGILSSSGMAPKFTINVKGVQYTDDESCLVTVDMIQEYQGETSSEEQILPMEKNGRDWLITLSFGDML